MDALAFRRPFTDDLQDRSRGMLATATYMLHVKQLWRKWHVWIVGVVFLARTAAFILPQVHFDADQAVTGLMAKHVAEGRAFPVFQYGHQYVLVLESWLAAGLVVLTGHATPM